MERVLPVLRLAARRGRADWRLLAAVAFGAILAAALMSSVILYADAVRDLGLSFTLRQRAAPDLDLAVTANSQPGEPTLHVQRRETTVSLLRRHAGSLIEGLGFHGRSSTFFLTQPGEPVRDDDELRPRAHFLFFSDLADRVTLVEGAPPALPPPHRAGGGAPRLEAWMSAEAARGLGAAPGDVFELHPFWRDDAVPLTVEITGLFEPLNADARAWFGNAGRLVVANTRWPTWPLVIEERALVETIAPYLPSIDGSFRTVAFVDRERVTSRNAEAVEGRLRGLERAVGAQLELSVLESDLADAIAQYRERLFFTRLPLFALMLLIVGIALYYLVLVGTMLAERRAGEIALLKSRGASSRQVLAVSLVEGLALAALATGLGPPLAAGAIRLLGPTPPFSALSQGELLRVALTAEAFGMALLGAMLALAALLWPAWRAARATVVSHRQALARPPRQPLFLRYYLDLALVGAGAFLFYQLRQRGSLVTERLFGDLSADPLLLVSPALFMLMIALLFLRLFPLVLRAASWALRGLGGTTVALGLWRMARSPLHHSRLILLLLLATSVGMFAAGFRATLDRSFADRAAHEAGAAGRIVGVREPAGLSPQGLTAAIEAIDGLDGAVAAARLDAAFVPETGRSVPAELLGAGEGLAGVAFWRDDFGGDLPDLLARLRPEAAEPPPAPAMLPAGTRAIGVWTRVSLPPEAARPGLRLRDDRGLLYEYVFAREAVAEDADGWRLYVTDLARPALPRDRAPDLARALELESIFLVVRRFAAAPGRATALLDDVLAWPAGAARGDAVVVEPFDSLDRYESITGASGAAETTVARARVERGGGGEAARIAFTYDGFTAGAVGLRASRPAAPLPVLASRSFLDATGLSAGDAFALRVNRQTIGARVAGAFSLFPGFRPGDRDHLLVADLAALREAARGAPRLAGGVTPNEVWLARVEGAPLTVAGLAENGVRAVAAHDRAAILARESSDPLVAASWEGILFLSFGAVLLLTALGFAVFSWLAARARSLEFAILRTMGFSGRQVAGLVAFEQLFVIVAGMAAGAALGFPLGRLMIGALALTEDGGDVVPPLLSQVSWEAVLTVYGLLALAFAATAVALARLYARLALHRALRIGEA